MITGYKQLTGRYLKASKKRALLTVIGIVLSVALISSIGLFVYSLQVTQILDAKNTYGAFHLIFTKADEGLSSKVVNNPKVSRSGFASQGEEVKIDDRLTVSEVTATDKALELLPYRAKQGRLPEVQNEAAVEKWVLSYIDKTAKVGDKIKFNNREYTLTGILEDSIQNQMDNKGVILTKNNSLNKQQAMLVVEVSSKANLKETVNELKQLASKDTVVTNAQLLLMLGAGEGPAMIGMFITLSIIISIVVIATIAVIYNSFQIGVVERIKQFGLLRAVGTTPKQIRKIVLREATILALIGVPLGLIFGVIAIYGIGLVFTLIGGNSVFKMTTAVSPTVLAISGAVGLASIYLSAFIPAFFAGRISPLVAISSRASITKEKIKRRKNRIVQAILGFEGALASKNIKRSRKRYRITVFSIVISVVLFITFKSFVDMTLTIGSTPNESKNMHFAVVRDQQATNENVKIDEGIIKNLQGLRMVDKVYRVYDAKDFVVAIDKDMEVKEVKNIQGIYEKDKREGSDKTLLRSSVVTYDAESMEAAKKYVESGNIDIKSLKEENGVIVCRKSRIFNPKTERSLIGPAADLKVGDEIELQSLSPEEYGNPVQFSNRKTSKVKVMAILENDPFNYRGNSSGIKMISIPEVTEKLSESKEIKPVNLNIAIKNIKDEEEAKAEIDRVISVNPALTTVNYIDSNRTDKTTLLMGEILMYGFVVVISLISSVNIVNTLTTNIILRRREFAALKSIGLTQRGLKKMITIEGLLYGIMGTLYGSIIGSGISYLLFKQLMELREFGWSIPWKAIAIAGAAALIIGYLSVQAPLARIKKENLIETIREDF